jgi:2-iminoacetate synthase ThiH
VSALVDQAILEAGLGELARARRALDFVRVLALAPSLAKADLLALGALADRVRAEEVGDVVTVFAGPGGEGVRPGSDVFLIGGSTPEDRSDLLRRVAHARITGPRAARVRVDWESAGIELAQVALGFGANELAGPIQSRRGLPILEGSTQRVKGAGQVSSQLLKKKELGVLVRMAGRVPVFVTLVRSPAGAGKEGSLEHA